MNLLIVAATPFEIQPLTEFLETNYDSEGAFHFSKNELDIKVLITGVGIAYTSFSLGHVLSINRFDLVINAGIAGAFSKSRELGDVVQVTTEQFGDLGVEERDGTFTDVFELNLIEKNQPPFFEGKIFNEPPTEFDFLPKCIGLTVSTVHGTANSIKASQAKYDADVESMEGAAFFLACKLAEVQFLQIRSISNYVEPRNKDNWNLPLAIENLNKVIIEIVETFEQNSA